jgi:hypothetical protein
VFEDVGVGQSGVVVRRVGQDGSEQASRGFGGGRHGWRLGLMRFLVRIAVRCRSKSVGGI